MSVGGEEKSKTGGDLDQGAFPLRLIGYLGALPILTLIITFNLYVQLSTGLGPEAASALRTMTATLTLLNVLTIIITTGLVWRFSPPSEKRDAIKLETASLSPPLPEKPSRIPKWLIYPTIVLGGVAIGFLLGVYFGGPTGFPVTQGQLNTMVPTPTFWLFVVLTPLAFLSLYVGISVLWNFIRLSRLSGDNERSEPPTSSQSEPNRSPKELIKEGDTAQTAGDTARTDGDYETAVEKYTTAVEAYRQARERLNDDDDRAEAVATALKNVESARRDVIEQRDQRVDLRQGLAAVEDDLAVATREHAQGNETVARIRYRQARDRCDDLLAELEQDQLEPSVEVSLEGDGRPEIGAVEGMTDAVLERVADANRPTPRGLQETDVDGLTEIDGIDEDIAQRLIAWARVPTSDTRQFDAREDITDRRALAIEGFQHCQ